MRRATLGLVLLLGVAASVMAAENRAQAPARLVVTINPEGRVSVVSKGELPATAPRGVPFAIEVEIVNQGFITGQLEAGLAGNAPAGASLGMDRIPLKGTPRESRTLLVTLGRAGTADLTIVFRIRHGIPDFGGLDRIHMLFRGV
ncbi:MAG TPA: hypothetical protein VFE25_01735 [Opitutaceae bacterium]|jgi:hypothetical protein|nr:hypothetical protein [Opitutaceae bacterium]